MANNHETKSSLPIAAIIVGLVAIVVVIVVFAFEFSSPTQQSISTAVPPTSSPSSRFYQPEVIPPLYFPEPTRTAMSTPTNTTIPTQTLVVVPTLISNSDLPDLVVSGLSDSICATEYEGTKLRFSIFIRNIGSVSTRNFGSFDTDVYLILGQRHYSLDEWATEFYGVVGSSIIEVANLNPNDDIKFTVVIDLKGNKDFGIEVVVNVGENPIREADTTNNTLIKYFSGYCY